MMVEFETSRAARRERCSKAVAVERGVGAIATHCCWSRFVDSCFPPLDCWEVVDVEEVEQGF